MNTSQVWSINASLNGTVKCAAVKYRNK